MIEVTVAPGELLMVEVSNVNDFSERCPEQFQALIEATAFVNWRRVEIGKPPLLALLLV